MKTKTNLVCFRIFCLQELNLFAVVAAATGRITRADKNVSNADKKLGAERLLNSFFFFFSIFVFFLFQYVLCATTD
jgi:hypothetical protein